MANQQTITVNAPGHGARWDERISIWLAIFFILANLAYFLLIPALGLKGEPAHAWSWAVVPVIDMLYISIQAFCLIVSGARSNEFGFSDIAVSWLSSVVMGVLACWVIFAPNVHISSFQTLVLVCNLVATISESVLTQFGRMAFSRRTIGLAG